MIYVFNIVEIQVLWSRPCSEQVITLFFQDRVSGALPDWATNSSVSDIP